MAKRTVRTGPHARVRSQPDNRRECAMTTELGETIRFDLPGRLGDPSRALKDDPRAAPRLVAALAPFGLDAGQPAPPVSPSSSRQELLAFGQGAEDGFGTVFSALFADLPPVTGVERR